MKAFVLKDGPFIKSQVKARHLSLYLLIALIPLVLFAWVKNGIYPYLHQNMTFQEMCLPIILIVSAVMTGIITHYLIQKIKKEKMNTYQWLNILNISFIFSLLLPIQTPIYFVVIASFVMTVLESCEPLKKYINPIVIGILLILLGNILFLQGNIYYNTYEQKQLVDTTSEAMITNNQLSGYQVLVQPYGRILDFILGSVPGGLGTTCSILLIFAFLYLCYKKAIKWEITITYILTVFGISAFIGLFSKFGYWYPIYQVISGGLLFGAIFLATDPMSTPTTTAGKVLYGLCLGIITTILRYFVGCNESVLISIFLMSLFSIKLDDIGSIARFHFEKSIPIFICIWICILALGIFIGTKYQVEQGIDVYQKRESI